MVVRGGLTNCWEKKRSQKQRRKGKIHLYSGQEATVRTRHGTMDWFQIGKGVQQSSILSSCLFNLYAEYLMPNTRLDVSQVGIKIAGRNINNLGYAIITTLMAESKKKLKNLLRRMKEKVKKLAWNSTFKKQRSWHPVPSLRGKKKGKKVEAVTDFIFLGSKITVDSDCCHEIDAYSLEGKLWKT